MAAINRVLFYDDAPEYGGHQVMAIEGVRHLVATNQCSVSFAFYERNARLFQELSRIKDDVGNIDLYPLKFGSRTLQAVRTFTSPVKSKYLTAFMKRINPDMVLVVQGRIESSSMGLFAAKRAKLYAISYIPMAHAVSLVGRSLLSETRERLNRYFYSLPDKIITISDSARQMLLDRGAKANITVVSNGIRKITVQPIDREHFRSANEITAYDYLVGIVGRIDFRQKGQDFAIESIARYRSELDKCKFVFVGDGHDRSRLEELIAGLGLQKNVRLLPWSDNAKHIYAGLDMLMIPSKYEGVPLVMLEGMSCGLPVIASDVDGMAELLPKDWLFRYGDSKGLIDTLLRVKTSGNLTLLDLNKVKVNTEYSISAFCDGFSAAVLE